MEISNLLEVKAESEYGGGRPPRYASAPASWQYLGIYSPGGTYSGMLAI